MERWSVLKKGKTANVGDTAPTFSLKGTTGPGLDLAEIRGKKRAVLIFYPEDCTSGCLDQLTKAGLVIEDFNELDAEVYGVNQATAESHQVFIDQLGVHVDLLVDENFEVSRAYDAMKEDVERISRTVVIVGKNGKIIFRAAGAPPTDELLRVIATAKDA